MNRTPMNALKKPFTLLMLLPVLSLAGCAISDDQAVSNNDIYPDPDTKRLEIKEDMTRVTRELSTNY